MIFKLVTWTDFGIPTASFYDDEAVATAHGEGAIKHLGCVRYTVAPSDMATALNTKPERIYLKRR